MTFANRAGLAAIALAAGIGLTGCGSETAGDATPADETSATAETTVSSTSEAPAPQTPAAGADITVEQYIAENGIEATPMRQGDPGAPTVTLPFPPGWVAIGDSAPEDAFDGIMFTGDPPAPAPATIVAFVTELTGNVDPAKILEYAPKSTLALPGFQGATSGQQGTLGGYDATQIGGFYKKEDGGPDWLIAEKTAVIPTDGGVLMLKLTAEGPEDLAIQLMEATAAIDEQTTITP